MKKQDSKQRLFEVMNKVAGMSLNEHNYNYDPLNNFEHVDWKKVYEVLDDNTDYRRRHIYDLDDPEYDPYLYDTRTEITDVISKELLDKLISGTENIKKWSVDDDDIYTSFSLTVGTVAPSFEEFMNVVKTIFT